GQAVLARCLRHRRLTPDDAQHQRYAALRCPPLHVVGHIRHRTPPLRGLRTTVVWVASTWRGAVYVDVRTQVEQRLGGGEATQLDRAEEGRLVLDDRVDVGTVRDEEADRVEIVAEGRRPQTVIGVGAALQEKLRERQVAATTHGVPERRGLPFP